MKPKQCKFLLFLLLLLTVALLATGCSSGQSTTPSISKENKEPIDFRNGGDINTIKHGDHIIISGQVIAGNGKKGSRDFSTAFGSSAAQPFILQDKSKNEVAVVLKKPSSESLYDKHITIKGIVDNKTSDPGILESYSVTTKKHLKLAIVEAETIN